MSATLLESVIRLLYRHRNEPLHHCALRAMLHADILLLRKARRA